MTRPADPSRFLGPDPGCSPHDNKPPVSETPSPDSLLVRTARGAGWVMAWRLGMRVLGLVSTLVLVRLIQPADFGIIALATSFMQTIDGMLTLGTEEAVIREATPGRTFYDTAFTLNLLRGLSVTVLVAALAYPAAAFFADPRLGPVLLFVACLPLLDGSSNIGAVDFRRDFAFHKEFAIMVLPKLCGIVAAMTAAVLLHSYVAMLFGMGVNRTLRVVMSYVMHPYRPGLSLKAWRGLAGYSVWTWLLSLAILVRDRSDFLLIGRLMNTAAVGFYSVGAEVAALPTTELIEPLGRAAFSGFAAGRQENTDPGETFLRLIGSAALLTLPAGVGLSLVAAPLVALAFGPGWEPAVPVLRILSLSFTIMVFGHLSLHLLSAHALARPPGRHHPGRCRGPRRSAGVADPHFRPGRRGGRRGRRRGAGTTAHRRDRAAPLPRPYPDDHPPDLAPGSGHLRHGGRAGRQRPGLVRRPRHPGPAGSRHRRRAQAMPACCWQAGHWPAGRPAPKPTFWRLLRRVVR